MNERQRQKFCEAHDRFDVRRLPVSGESTVAIIDADHTPWNKRFGEIRATATIEVTAMPGWVSFTLTEDAIYASGRTQARVISMTVSREMANKIACHILGRVS